MKKYWMSLLCVALMLPTLGQGADDPASRVRLTTSAGVIEIELDHKRAPVSAANFVRYVESGFYDGTIFHRVMPGFMIQGGGFTPGLKPKDTRPEIQNEANNGLKNKAGTIAMARTPDPHSASSQFFINTVDNPGLDHTAKTMDGWGYAVFGKVTKGMDVVKKIEKVQTADVGMHEKVPRKDVVIKKAELIKN
jgi:cyclophilin family peptidyl-prolyl cis-trans isomerase